MDNKRNKPKTAHHVGGGIWHLGQSDKRSAGPLLPFLAYLPYSEEIANVS